MKYDAFISYRHSEADKFVAENLHKKLEAFRLPNSIVKQRGKDCKKKIERVFRDRDELPLAANLADPITQALADSEFLIVICSPRLPQSMWCKKEIETFISMHGRQKVLAVLIEGEPDEAFPEELLYRTREVAHEDGTVEIVKESVEPLAADVRGSSKKDVLKKMDEELLRLAAAMFDCAYDDLKQRHKEQKMKKMLTASLAASAFFLAFGAVSTTMAVRIQSQNEQIQAQSEEIQVKAEQIQLQKEEIELQYQQALYNQSLSMAEKSLDLLEEGDRLEAMKLALDALGDTEDGTPMPVTAEAQYALAESSYVYQPGENWLPTYMLKHDANISVMEASPDGTLLMTADKYGNVCIWDILSNKIIDKIEGDYFSSASEEDCFFINNNQILYKGEDSFEVYDVTTKKVVLKGEENFYRGVADTENGRIAVVMGSIYDELLQVYDSNTLELLYSYDVPEKMSIDATMTFGNGGTLFAYVLEPEYLNEDGGDTYVNVLDITKGEIIGKKKLMYSDYKKIQIVDSVLYAAVCETVDEAHPDGDWDMNIPFKSLLCAINLSDMSIKWQYRNDEASVKDFKINAGDFSRHMLVSYYSDAQMLDMDTGELLYKFAYGEEIISTLYYVNSDNFIIMLRDGEYHQINGGSGMDVVFIGHFKSNSDNIKMMLPAGNGFAMLPYSDCNVTYCEMYRGSDYEVWHEQDETISNVLVNKDESRAVIVEECGDDGHSSVLLKSLSDGQIIAEIDDTDNVGVEYGLVGDGEKYFYIFERENVNLYNISDGSLYARISLDGRVYADYIVTGADRKSLIFRDSNTFGKLDIELGAAEYIDIDRKTDNSMKLNISPGFDIYAVADKEENAILLYRVEGGEEFLRIDTVAPLVEEMVFTEDGKYLFVYYMDESIKIYSAETGACVQEYKNFGDCLNFGVTSCNEGYAVSVLGGVYIINKDFEKIALLPSKVWIMDKSQKFLLCDGDTIYSCPVYPVDELKGKAEEILSFFLSPTVIR